MVYSYVKHHQRTIAICREVSDVQIKQHNLAQKKSNGYCPDDINQDITNALVNDLRHDLSQDIKHHTRYSIRRMRCAMLGTIVLNLKECHLWTRM